MNEKILSLVEDKAFFEKLKGCTNADEFADVMTEFGVELNDTDPETAFAQFKSGVAESKSGEAAELSEAELTAVAGGVNLNPFYWIGYGIGKLVQKAMGGSNVCWY